MREPQHNDPSSKLSSVRCDRRDHILATGCDRARAACGSGQWTVELATYASHLPAVDASPEILTLNRASVPRDDVVYMQADQFDRSLPEHYDVVFFFAWLSVELVLMASWGLVVGWVREPGYGLIAVGGPRQRS